MCVCSTIHNGDLVRPPGCGDDKYVIQQMIMQDVSVKSFTFLTISENCKANYYQFWFEAFLG